MATPKAPKTSILRNFGVSHYNRIAPNNTVLSLQAGQAAVVDRKFAQSAVADQPDFLEIIDTLDMSEEDALLVEKFVKVCGKYAVFPFINGQEKCEVSEEVKVVSLQSLIEAGEAMLLPEDEDEE